MADRSEFPSQVVLPEKDKDSATLLDFLEKRFPKIDRSVWEKRMENGSVLDTHLLPIRVDEPYIPGKRIFYFREIQEEISVPFQEEIVYSDSRILVVSKPHFLPVIPAGPYVNQCLLNRLKKTTGNGDLSPIHRIDRETAGLVVFSVDLGTRGLYQQLFMENKVRKTYEAVTDIHGILPTGLVQVENRIVTGDPFFRMKTEQGTPNARSRIECIHYSDRYALFRIQPETGKKHQIRLHLSGLGFGIVNDRYYPDLLPEQPLNFDKPLQLLARSLEFTDPVSEKNLSFTCSRSLMKINQPSNQFPLDNLSLSV